MQRGAFRCYRRRVLRILPLGGLGEVGMNCLAIEADGEVLVVDCGVTFDDRHFGVDVIHPDFQSLEDFEGKIRGVVITHGHEDHIGALPYFLKRFDVPVYAPKYALGVIRERLDEHEILSHARLHETTPRSRFSLGGFEVEPIRVTHSIVDATALAIGTRHGKILHTGDFKFDESLTDPADAFDVARIEELAHDGLDLLMSDSTNVDSAGSSGSEALVAATLAPLVEKARGAVVTSLFASNVHRLRLLGRIAQRTKRRVVILGRSMAMHIKVARSLGYLDWPEDLIFPVERVRELPREKILAIATGSQAEPQSALARISRNEHRDFVLAEGDTVLLSSRVIPGNEPEVSAVIDALLQLGVAVVDAHAEPGIHVSGHACREEQRRMIERAQPKAFLPLHGTFRHLQRHADLARQAGVPSVAVISNGTEGLYARGTLEKGHRFDSGRVAISHGDPIAASVLHERALLAEHGVVSIIAAVDRNYLPVGELRVELRGAVEGPEHPWLAAELGRAVRGLVASMYGSRDAASVGEKTRQAVRRVFAKNFGIKPEVLVALVRSAPAEPATGYGPGARPR